MCFLSSKKIYTFVFFNVFLFLYTFFSFGSSCAAQQEQETYYLLYLTYNVPSVSAQLKEKNSLGEDSLSLTKYNFTRDTGSGSQFYAQVLNSKNKPEIFSSNFDRFYLGQWQARMFWDGPRGGGSEDLPETEVQISIPYFPDGRKVNIYRADNDQLALSVDVSRFAVNLGNLKIIDTENNDNQTTKDGGETLFQKTNVYLWIVFALTLVAATSFGIWLWKRKKEEI